MAVTDITPKQEAFCVAYIKSGNASAAYREAYDAENMSDGAIWTNASQLLKNAKVALRLSALRAAVVESSNVSLQSHLADLLWLREQAAAAGKYSAAVTAEMARGKVVGLYIDRLVASLTMSDDGEKKLDLSTLTLDEKRAMLEMLEKTGIGGQLLQ